MLRFSALDEVQAHLDGLGLFHMDLTLGRMQGLVQRAGLAAPSASVQVLGTNGKGSTAGFLASVAQAHGRRVGLYTSPHFLTFRERLRIGGAMLPEARWVALANRVWALGGGPDALGLTYFEFLTAAAWLAMAEEGVEVAIWEAGLGGRMDATTALPRHLALFTPMGLDHVAILGPTLADIAADKAGAMAPGMAAITGPQPDDALAVLRRVAAEQGVPLLHTAALADLPAFPLGLSGPHQPGNAALALAGWCLLAKERGWAVDPALETRGLAATFVPGRLQTCQGRPRLLLDAAHNPPAMAVLIRALKDLPRPLGGIIFTCLADKDLPALAALLAPLLAGGVPVLVPVLGAASVGRRGRDPAQVAACFPGQGRVVASVAQALDALRDAPGPVLACGSMYLLAEIFALRPQCLQRSCA